MKYIINTYYGPIKSNILIRANKIRLLICDADGVMSNGLIYMSNNNDEFMTFNVRDGYGIRCLKMHNIEIAIITNRFTNILKNRAKILGIDHLYQKQFNKCIAFYDLLKKLSLKKEQVVYIGDDLIDWPVMKQVGLSVAVSNAHPFLINKSHYVTKNLGGHGAIRELCDIILLSQNKLENLKI
ncbi:3-deoxy-D-manno-octulosonate 8-phosphate phosphatase KdsC [Serratia symbiotica]|nr:3-deoxy-D-manno-octulosonate 8-phosphate phosphatase KdsC [Serratia symbiotica]